MPAAETLEDFENVLLNKKCAIGPVPPDRWRHDDFYHPDPHTKGHYIIPKMGFCEKYYHFDPGYFHMSPRETLFTDPQQRQVLQITAEALQDAGYKAETIDKDTGVYIGMGIIDFPGALVENRFLYNAHTLTGFSHSCAANRVSHFYGLRGPSVAVDTACAASLTALHMACVSIWNGENRVAIAGATSNLYSPETTIAFSHLGVLSASGTSAPFDVTNDGYVRAEGTGIVLLKPLEDALKDGDHVYNVIRATTSAHNGNSNSLTLPSAEAQEELIRRCYDQFKIPMEKVSFVEAHGTGTPVGDPLETKALGNTLGAGRADPLPIQSAKSNFGHLEVAAGMVQVIKAALMLEKRMFYPQINWTSPNPGINLEELNLKIQLDQEEYSKQDKFLIGINTFGFGGSLVHMVFEEYRPIKRNNTTIHELASWTFGDSQKEGKFIAIPISAKTKTALQNTLQKWLEWSSDEDAQSVVGWLATRREHYREHRLVILANSGTDFRDKIHNFIIDQESNDAIKGSKRPAYEKPPICFVFPEDKECPISNFETLYTNSHIFRESVHGYDSEFQSCYGTSIMKSRGMFNQNALDDHQIHRESLPKYIPHFQIGLAALLANWGILAKHYIGHGIGENIANYIIGGTSKQDFWNIKEKRKQSVISTISEDTLVFTNVEHEKDPHLIVNNDNSSKLKKSLKLIVKSILKEHPNTIFIELSGTPTIHPIIESIAPGSTVFSLDLMHKDGWTCALEVISKLHVSGYPVDWNAVTNYSAQYASIPLYGWDEMVYRLESDEYYARRLGLRERTFRRCNGRINFELFPYLNDYILHGHNIFPAAAFIEYFAEYAESATMTMRNVTIHANTEVPPFTSDGHIQTLVLKVKRDSTSLKAVTVADEVQAEAELFTLETACPCPLNIEEIKSRCSMVRYKDDAYGQLSKMGFAYGWFFKVLSHIEIGNCEAISVCMGSNAQLRHESIGTTLMDAAFQTAIVAFTRAIELYLPKHVQQVNVYDNKVICGSPFYVYVTLAEYSLKSIVCDISVANEDGHVYLSMEGFRAESQAIFDSNVNYNNICYSQIWQQASGAMVDVSKMKAVISSIDTPKENIKKLKMLERLICALSRDIQQEYRGTDLPENLLELANQADGTSSDCVTQEIMFESPDLLPEVKVLEKLTATIKQSLYNGLARQDIQGFFRSSSIIADSLGPIKNTIKYYIAEALQQKQTITICEVGDGIGILTAGVYEVVKDLMHQGKVEYVCRKRKDDICSKFIRTEPTVKLIDSDDEFYPQFDLIIIVDSAGKCSCPLTGIHQLLLDNGQLIGVQPQPDQGLFRFLFPKKRDPEHLCTVLKSTNFVDVDHTSDINDEFWVTVFARKSTLMHSIRDIPAVLSHVDSENLVKDIQTFMTPHIATYNIEDILARRNPEMVEQSLDLICIITATTDTLGKLQELATKISDRLRRMRSICCIYLSGTRQVLSGGRMCMEIFLSTNPDSNVILINADDMGSADIASLVLRASHSQTLAERYQAWDTSGCKVPRIMKLKVREELDNDEMVDTATGHSSRSLEFKIQSAGSYIVLDGGHSHGLEVARWLSDAGADKIILVTQSPVDCFISSTIKYMKSNGTDVFAIHSQSSSYLSMAENCIKFLQTLESCEIKGIFFINEAACRPEIHQDINLAQDIIDAVQFMHDTTKNHEVDHFVLFSSMDSFLMSCNNIHASAIGAAFDEICLHRRNIGRKSLSLHLGGVSGPGTQRENKQTTDALEGNYSLHIHEYLDVLGHILQRDEYAAVIAITHQDWAKTYNANERSGRLFQHLAESAGGQCQTDQPALSDLDERCKNYLADLTGTPHHLIDPSHPMTEYGVDSLMSHDIVTWAQRTLGVNLTQTDVFAGLSIEQLLANA